MKTSVIIPTINRRDDLQRLLDSLFEGALQPDEIIIIEQGDVQKTEELVGCYPDIVNVYGLEEASASIARNKGVEKSTGDILFFFDDDMVVDGRYLDVAVTHFKNNQNTVGITGTYMPGTRRFGLKRILGIFFAMYSTRAQNIVLRSGSYDFIRGENLSKEQSVQWLYGGNMVLKKSLFEVDGFVFNKDFKKGSFGEDVFLTYAIYKKYPKGLYYLPALQIVHNEGRGAKSQSVEAIKMKLIYRYIFWKKEVWNHSVLNTFAYIWSQIGTMLLELQKDFSVKTFITILKTYCYIIKNSRKISSGTVDFNNFIFIKPMKKELWRTSVFGKFPFVRVKQIIANPAFFSHFLKRFFVYKYTSHNYISRYEGFTFLTPKETIDYLIDNNASLARFSDGDIEQLTGAGEYPPDSDWSQRSSKKLIKEIERVLYSKNPNLLIAHESPKVFLMPRETAKKEGVVYNMWTDTRIVLWKYLDKNQKYGHAHSFVPSHYPDFDWRKLKNFLEKKDVIIVTGGIESLQSIKLGRKLFFFDAGKHDAFERYSEIVCGVKKIIQDNDLQKEDVLVMASLGPTADILALDLTEEGYRVWDTGHMFKFASKELALLSDE